MVVSCRASRCSPAGVDVTRRDPVDQPCHPREQDAPADQEGDEHVRPRGRLRARRSGRTAAAGWPAAPRRAWRVERLAGPLQAGEAPQHQGRGQAHLGDEHDQPEEQRPVPLPAVERHDHVDGRGRPACRSPASQAMIFTMRLLLDRDPSAVAVDLHHSPLGQVATAPAYATTVATPALPGQDREVRQHRPGLGHDAAAAGAAAGPGPGVSVVVTRTEPGGRVLGVVGDRPPADAAAGAGAPAAPRRALHADRPAAVGRWNQAGSGAPTSCSCFATTRSGTTTARLVATASTSSSRRCRISSGSGSVAGRREAHAQLPRGPAGQLLHPAHAQPQRLAEEAVVVAVLSAPSGREVDGASPSAGQRRSSGATRGGRQGEHVGLRAQRSRRR